nr:hypothetical protein [Tanacetum cinerariifolium]
KKKVIITEASIRRDLRFEDERGVDCLSNEVIFEQLTLMGTMASAIICLATNQKFNFSKGIFDNMVWTNIMQFLLLLHTKKVFANMKREGKDFSSKVTPLFQSMMKKKKSRRKQRKAIEVPSTSSEIANEECVPTTSNDPLPSGEDRMKPNELMILCTNLQKQGRMNKEDMFRVNDLDGDEVVVDVSASEKVDQSVKAIEKEVSTADPVTTVGEVVTNC